MALQRLGPFELLRVLGRGGMGTVYEAREVDQTETVAVKALSPAYSFNEHFRNRFEGEIDALMKLDHKNIVRLLSYGQDEGNLFFAMELVEGSSLYQEQKQGQVFHWREIIDIGIQVCEGLRHAHDRGIIHRDLKPGNLMIDSNRNVKITDFGIAKSFGGSSLTSEGNVLGTMDFMAPEQARGKGTTVRSDLFSLGAVLYSLLTGRPPFLKTTVEQTFASLLSSEGPERLDLVAPDVPKPLTQLIHRLLEKNPEKRIPTAQATGRKLEYVLDVVQNDPAANETQVVAADAANDEFETRVVNVQTGNQGVQETSSSGEESHLNPTSVSESKKLGKQIKPSQAKVDTTEFQSRQPDYYNEVTPQQRQKKSELVIEERKTTSAWPLVLALIVVLALAGVGIWQALFQKPSEEELLTAISAKSQTPVKVIKEIKLYLELYPESENAAGVVELLQLAEADQFFNTIRLRQNAAVTELSQVQQKLIEIVNYDQRNAPFARHDLVSFLRVHESNANLSSDDIHAVNMAKRLVSRVNRDAERQIQTDCDIIRDAMESAKGASRKRAMGILEGLQDMYGKGATPWTDKLLEKVNEELLKLKKVEDGDNASIDESNGQ